MKFSEIRRLIKKELTAKKWGISEQLLEIHQPILENKKVKIAKIKKKPKQIIVYLTVENEKFYFVFYINSKSRKIIGISTESFISICFRATSDKINFDEMQKLTKLQATKGWNKGELRNNSVRHKLSSFIFDLNYKPQTFEKKLSNLLKVLKNHKREITKLSKKAYCIIQVYMEIHNGNGMIGGPNMSRKNIKKLSKLNLSVDFDQYVSGNEFKS